jgi:hypothetical protein
MPQRLGACNRTPCWEVVFRTVADKFFIRDFFAFCEEVPEMMILSAEG